MLVVEDEPATRLGLTELIRTWGFTTDAASDGEEALSRITAFRPSIIISDLVMPRMGGLELLRALADEAGLDPQFAEAFLNFIVAEVIHHHERIAGNGS